MTSSPSSATAPPTASRSNHPRQRSERALPVRILPVSEQPVRCLGYSPDSRLLATGDDHGDVRLWSLPDGALTGAFRLGHTSVEALAFHPFGKTLVTGNAAGVLALWQVGGAE